MCGIVAALPAYPEIDRTADGGRLAALLDHALSLARKFGSVESENSLSELAAVTNGLRDVEREVSTAQVGWLLTVDTGLRQRAFATLDEIDEQLVAIDARLDTTGETDELEHVAGDRLEQLQSELRAALDLAWTVRQDRLVAAERVVALFGDSTEPTDGPGPTAVIAYYAVDTVLDGVDRLEVRGRDSAGVHLWISLDDTDRSAVAAMVDKRTDPLFRCGAMVLLPRGISIVYKTASVIGRLGDNVRRLRGEIAADCDLHAILALPSARVTVLAHTRWASVGRVSEANAHPLNSRAGETLSEPSPYAVAVLNGDIDNYLSLASDEGIRFDGSEIGTDARLIPEMTGRGLLAGLDGPRAVARSLERFQGSMAIAVQADDDPDRLILAVRGSGQNLQVGLSDNGYLIASEAYGLVSRTSRYVDLRAELDAAGASDGVVVCVRRSETPDLDGISLVRPEDPSGRAEVPDSWTRVAEVSTRDLSRRGYERYLEKELAEASASFRKTLRGRIRQRGRHLRTELAESALPATVRAALREGRIGEVLFLGQGTAAVAAEGGAHLLGSVIADRMKVSAMPATEFSAWHLKPDMSGICLVVISQSGTTTDTNRAVDLARSRGAHVLAIVNRRNSDLVGKADGVVYTSDGRDIELAVASTKAFYAQVAAGALLGLAMAKEVGTLDDHTEDALLHALRAMPGQLDAVQQLKPTIAATARQVATRYPHWAVLGSGPNLIAADEIRIKVSELCYRTISTDAIEDKKHIDLSAESLVLVCCAGAPATQLPDLVKEIDIFTAHRNVPVVIADSGAGITWPTELVIEVPPTHPSMAWLLSTAVGHLFGYFAAQAIDEAANPLRAALAALDGATGATGPTDRAVAGLSRVRSLIDDFLDECGRGTYRGVLGSDTALHLANARWSLAGLVSSDAIRGPASLSQPDADALDLIRQVLTDGADHLTRSIDSVKHQAKTVTVGTSRSGADLVDNQLVDAILDLSVPLEALSHSSLLALHGMAQVITDVTGATRYSVHDQGDAALAQVLQKRGIATDLPSRADAGTVLTGTKKLVVDTRSVRLARGGIDGRTVLIVPELSGRRVNGISLLHVRMADRTSPAQLVAAMEATGIRLAEMRAAVTENDGPFVLERLAALPTETALLAPVDEVARAISG